MFAGTQDLLDSVVCIRVPTPVFYTCSCFLDHYPPEGEKLTKKNMILDRDYMVWFFNEAVCGER